jgi:hypothetical protein
MEEFVTNNREIIGLALFIIWIFIGIPSKRDIELAKKKKDLEK